MAYTSANLRLVVQTIGNKGPSLWTHESVDAGSVVQVTGYITDGGDRGMKAGDLVWHTDNDASPILVTSHSVVTVSATAPGAVDLGAGVSLTSSNND